MYLDSYINQIIGLCKIYKVKHLFVFGSVLNNNFNEDSDIDFIVDIKSEDPIEYAENYFNFKFKLQSIINKPIDLLEEKGVKNSFLLKNINDTKKLIYEA